jgi:hypothetical protein
LIAAAFENRCPGYPSSTSASSALPAASMAQRSGRILGLHDHGEDGFHLDPLAAQFRNGSNSEVCVRNWEVRSALNNGHRQQTCQVRKVPKTEVVARD